MNINFAFVDPWTASILCPNGVNFITATPDIGDNGTDVTPIHTDAKSIGPDEIFSINQVFIYNFVNFHFVTTNDDLSDRVPGRGPSGLGATFTLSDGNTFTISPVNKDSNGNLESFGNNSVNNCTLPLAAPLTADCIKSIELTLNQPPNT